MVRFKWTQSMEDREREPTLWEIRQLLHVGHEIRIQHLYFNSIGPPLGQKYCPLCRKKVSSQKLEAGASDNPYIIYYTCGICNKQYISTMKIGKIRYIRLGYVQTLHQFRGYMYKLNLFCKGFHYESLRRVLKKKRPDLYRNIVRHAKGTTAIFKLVNFTNLV